MGKRHNNNSNTRPEQQQQQQEHKYTCNLLSSPTINQSIELYIDCSMIQ